MFKKQIFSLHETDIDWLKSKAEAESVSVVDILRRAIRIERFLSECERKGQKLLIEDTNGKTTEIIRI